jgi:hypothetical protein
MHRIDHRHGEPDVLFALDGPIREMKMVVREDYAGKQFITPELPINDSWHRVTQLPTPKKLQSERVIPKRMAGVDLVYVACAYCNELGRLTPSGDSVDRCPCCSGSLELVYVDS